MNKLRGHEIPTDLLMKPAVSFEEIVASIAAAPRPVSLAEVAYNLTGNPHYQHYLNPTFSGTKNEAKRNAAGLVVAYTKGRTHYWTVQ